MHCSDAIILTFFEKMYRMVEIIEDIIGHLCRQHRRLISVQNSNYPVGIISIKGFEQYYLKNCSQFRCHSKKLNVVVLFLLRLISSQNVTLLLKAFLFPFFYIFCWYRIYFVGLLITPMFWTSCDCPHRRMVLSYVLACGESKWHV